MVVEVSSIRDDFRAPNDQLRWIVGLKATDLVPVPIGHVIGKRDEVQTCTLRARAERVLERLAHRCALRIGVFRVNMEVALVPTGLFAGRFGLVGRGLPGLVEVGRIARQEDLQSPGHSAVGVAFLNTGDGGDPHFGRPLARRDGSGFETERRLFRSNECVEPTGAAPTAELLHVEEAVRAPAVIETEVERVLDLRGGWRFGLVVTELHTNAGGAHRHVERHEHIRALHVRTEGSCEHHRRGPLARAGGRWSSRCRREGHAEGYQEERDKRELPHGLTVADPSQGS